MVIFEETRRILGSGLAAVLVASLILSLIARPAEAVPNVFTVDRSDDPDLSTNPIVDNCTAVAADCSLRGAISKANRTANDAAGPDEIQFNIPGAGPHTISPTSPLPNINSVVIIDGYTQTGASERTGSSAAVLKIALSGASAGQTFPGLSLETGANSTKVRGLVIQRFSQGIVINAQNTVVEGNYIGTNISGDSAQGNSLHGVRVQSSGNLIGGTTTGARNVISGNGDTGVVIDGPATQNNRVEGNRIGTNTSGTAALGNDQGVSITDGSNNSIGSPVVGASNLIAGNSGRGILIAGEATDNKVQSNFIGTDGTVALGNATEGVKIFEGSNNVIGGTASRTGNIISGNGTDGVELELGAENNRIEGNLIGTGQNGATDLGNGEVGALVRGTDNVVGGTASGARNVISGNSGVGVSMLGIGASGNRVQGNIIGTQVDGTTPLPNFHGVFVSDATDNTIGGGIAAAANTISGNTNNGVQIVGSTGNRILRNSIFNNGSPGGLGIELGNDGVTTNDRKDPDTGANGLQNFPVITSARTTRIEGTLDSRPRKTLTVQIFLSPAANFPTFFGEGKTFVKEISVRTNRKGKGSFTANLASPLPVGQVVAATATDGNGNTSEFSAVHEVQ